ncbi:MAG: glycosyltransferase family 4 protein [Candidatus Magasanikbacteria bacterium]|nr:glycosyltransferase family 4 protein [Candidatus Magasanikbacteria bacterium]
MKIAMIGQKGAPALYGGIERHVEELSKELVKNGHEVLLYARRWFTPEKITEHCGIKIIHTPTVRTKHLDAIIHTFVSTIHAIRQKPDVIHYHGVGPSLLSWIPRVFAPRIRVISTFHCIDRYHQKWGVFARMMLLLGERAACAFPHQTIAVSKTIQSYCLNEYHHTTVFNPNGVNVEENPGDEPIGKWDLKTGNYLLMVSRLVRHKGAHYLIEAWQKARRDRPDLLGNIKLAIVGGSSFTDDYVRRLKQMADGDTSIIFTDWQSGDALHALYANCLMLVHPSENEGLPITVLQAMSYGRPALVSNIPEHQEVITDGRFWSANASVFTLAKKIIDLVSNPELLASAGIQNKETVIRDYQWEDIARRTLDIYRKHEPLLCEEPQIA